MKIPFRRVCAVFFSPTGSTAKMTEYLAECIAKKADVRIERFEYTLPKGRQKAIHFRKDDLVVLGSPVYAGRTPNRMLPFLESVTGEETPVVLLAMYGNRSYGDALTELRNVTEANGFIPVAAAAMIGSHPMSRVLGTGAMGAGRPNAADMEKAGAFAGRVYELLCEKGLPEERLFVPGNDPVGPYYRPLGEAGEPVNFLKAKPLTNDSCTACGDCVKCCPEGAINRDDPHVVSGICIKCMACVEICKEHAKYFTDENLLSHSRYLEAAFAGEQKEAEYYGLWDQI